MRILGSKDISNLVNKIQTNNENLDIFAGSEKDKLVILKKGFKIRHIPSGLIYTVIKVIDSKDDKGLKILCQRPGKKLLIPDNEFKNYERQ